jgi:site-specific DNA recombinase
MMTPEIAAEAMRT